MATVNLGAIKFNWKGAYNNSTAYVVDDVVSSGGSSYVCILASQGNAVSNGTYWNQMSAAGTNGTNGTNGTDVGTVITTQGDMLYRDGSGLQRLAKGTAAQELRMNSGATAPEWYTPSAGGGLILISTISHTGSNVTELQSGVVFSSTYSTYLIDFAEIDFNGDDDIKMYLGNSSAYVSSDNFSVCIARDSDNAPAGNDRTNVDNNIAYWPITGAVASIPHRLCVDGRPNNFSGRFYIGNPYESTGMTTIHGQSSFRNPWGANVLSNLSGMQRSSAQYDRFKLNCQNGFSNPTTIRIYGVTK